jgi:hypothetical protein
MKHRTWICASAIACVIGAGAAPAHALTGCVPGIAFPGAGACPVSSAVPLSRSTGGPAVGRQRDSGSFDVALNDDFDDTRAGSAVVTHALSTAVSGSVVHQAGDAARSTEAAFDPEAPALMLAGLAVLGFVAHRRGTST